MFTGVRKYLSPPVFTDTDVNFTARNLNVILLSAFAGIVLTIIRYVALGKIWRGNTGLILITGAFVIVFGYFLLRRCQILVGSLVTVTVLTLMPFLMMIEGDGIHDTAIMLLPVVVIVASMLFQWRGLIAHVAVIALIFGFLVRMETRGFLRPLSLHPVTNSDFTDALTILTVAAMMSGLLAASVRRSLRRLNNALHRREMAEISINQRDAILQATAFAAQAFLQSAHWQENIHTVLGRFGEATQASHVYIFENHTLPDGTTVTSQRYEWVAPHGKPEIDNPEFQNVPLQDAVMDRWYQVLGSGHAYVGYDETMPPDEAEFLRERGVLSIVDVPIFVRGTWWGIIGFDDTEKSHKWSAAEVEALKAAASVISAAIENARLFQETKQRANEMALLYQISVALASGENLYTALRAFVQELRRWMIVDTFYVGLYEEQTSTISFPLYLANDNDQHVPPRNLKEQPGLTKEVLDGRKTLYLPDLGDPVVQARHNIVRIVTLDIHSFVGIPLLLENKIIGVMSVQSIQPNAYTPDQIRLLETLAAQVAITIEKARLFESERQALSQSETLRESVAIITATLDESEAIRQILEQLQRVVPYDKASVQLIRDDHLVVVDGQGLSPDFDMGKRFPINDKEPSLPILIGEVPYLIFENITESSFPNINVPVPSNNHTWMFVPLKVKGRVFGLIALDGFRVRQFTERHAQLAVTYADQVAIALENTRLYESARQELTERKKTQLELEASNRELESLSYNIAHDMRSPVRAMVGLSQMLQHSQGDKMDEDGRSELERIHRAAKRLGNLIDGFLEYLRLGRSPLHKQTLELELVLRGLVNRFGAAHSERDIQFILGDFPACEADIALLEQAWSHLIANAVKFTRSRPQARIELGSGEKDGERHYFIRDNGIGFDMKYAEKIFVIFQHLNRQEDYEGVGVGLAIVQRIIHRHGGRIWAEAAPDQGATFYFTLA